MLLRIQEEMHEGIGIRFYVQISQRADAAEWLTTNGFQHHDTQNPETDYWTREGNCAVTFKNGIFNDGHLMMTRAKNTLRADFVYELELIHVICEDL